LHIFYVQKISIPDLTNQQFHPTRTQLQRIAEGFIVSSTAAAVISAMLGTMLLFRYEGYTSCTRKDLALAWSPLVMLDWSILAFLAGLVTWYKDKNPGWRADLVGVTVGVGLVYTLWVSVDMYFTIKRPGGLGKDDPFADGIDGTPKAVEESGLGNEEQLDDKLNSQRQDVDRE
jgi:hypothetical protein